jgi:hypothetical protein
MHRNKRTAVVLAVLVPVGSSRCRLFTPIDGATTSVAAPEVSMESLILAQDERWRRA